MTAYKGTPTPVIHLTPPAPFEVAFTLAMPHGLVAGIHLPPTPDRVPDAVLVRLHPQERRHAEGLHGYRQVEWVGGRLAMGLLLQELGVRATPVLPDTHGAPTLPDGFAGSISHKRDLAVALVARAPGGLSLGVDLEDLEPARLGVADRVLRPEERAAVDALATERRWVDVATRFAVKEAVYKALHRVVPRYIGFEEAHVEPSPDGWDRVTLHLATQAPDVAVEARHTWVEGPGRTRRVMATVRVRAR